MKKHFFLTGLLLLCSLLNIYAGSVNEQTARTVAINFYKNASTLSATVNPSASLKYTKTGPNGVTSFYVFDIAPKGFVIVAADDNVEPVIGYSTENIFSTDNMDQYGLSDWINTTAEKISAIIDQHVLADATISGKWNTYINNLPVPTSRAGSVSPLLTTRWNQNPYYNAYCPYSSTYSTNAVTGCVATAMAQIMKYWNYPAQGTGSYSYTHSTYGAQSANFGATTYQWAQMPATVNSTNYAPVATLMYHCGVAVAMDYGTIYEGGSGAYVMGTSYPSAQKAYGTYFGYNASAMKGVHQKNYSATDWMNLLKTELNAGRPIQYQGFDPGGGGHTWVCDGYDANNLLHMNWGWGGYSDGYFGVNSLTAGSYNFSTNAGALIGIQPGTTPATCNVPAGLSSSAITANTATVSWNTASGATSYTLQYKTAASSTWTSVTATSTSYNLTGLTAGTTYNFQVRTVCSGGSSAYSAAASFTTTAGTCGVPTALSTSNVTTTSATVSWGAVSGATSYKLQYRKSGTSTWTTLNASSTSGNLSGLTAGTTYNFQVQSVCSGGSSAYSAAAAFTTSAAATCGVPASLSASNTTSTSATLSWGAVSGATSYRLQYKTAAASTWVTVSTSSTSTNLSGLSAGTTYNYQVQTVCSSGSSAYSPVASFTTAAAQTCGIAIGLAATSVTTNSAIVAWLAVGGASSYNLQYKASSATTWNTIQLAGLTTTLTNLTPGTAYNFQVQTVCAGGASAYSPVAAFTTLTSCGVPSGLAASAVTATTATVSWSTVSGATSYRLQYKTVAATAWTTLTTTNTTANLSNLSAGTTYNLLVQTVCASGTSAFSGGVTFTTASQGTGPVTYCTSKGTSTAFEHIKSVAFGSFSNTSGNNSGYGNYTAMSIPLSAGASKSFTLTPGFTYGAYNEYWTIYIDYNKNGSFTDAGEKAYVSGGSTSAVSGSISVPAGLSGTTTMRIIMTYSVGASPCGGYYFGETEDYTVNFSAVGALGGDDDAMFTDPGITEVSALPMLYPNPATELVNIRLTPVEELEQRVEVYSLTGQMVASQLVGAADLETSLNITELPSGIYMVRSFTGDRARTEKLIKP